MINYEYRNDLLLDLLCVIHRDGGQYIDEHGVDKAVEDAMQLSSERIATQFDHPAEDEEEVDIQEGVDRLLDRINRQAECLAFFRSVIQCGEDWTDTCTRHYKAALK
jgi:hypothetical protein